MNERKCSDLKIGKPGKWKMPEFEAAAEELEPGYQVARLRIKGD